MVHHPDSSLLFSGKVRPALPPHRLNRRLDCRSGKEDCGAKADGECRVSQNRYGEAQMLGWLLPFPLLSFPPLSFASVSFPFRSFVPFTFLPCLEGLGRKVRGGRAEPRGRQDAQKKDWPVAPLVHPPHPSLPFPCAFLSLPPTYSCPNQPVYPPWRPSLVSPDRQTWCGRAGCGAEANHSHQCRGLIWRRRSTLPPMSGTEMPQTRFLLANVNDEIRNEIRTRHARDTQRDTRRV